MTDLELKVLLLGFQDEMIRLHGPDALEKHAGIMDNILAALGRKSPASEALERTRGIAADRLAGMRAAAPSPARLRPRIPADSPAPSALAAGNFTPTSRARELQDQFKARYGRSPLDEIRARQAGELQGRYVGGGRVDTTPLASQGSLDPARKLGV